MEPETSATALIDKIEAALQRRLLGRVCDLHVLLQDQNLVLRGTASTYYAKQLAQQVAVEVTGLRILVNEIEVKP